MNINIYECPICLSNLERRWEFIEAPEKIKWVRDEARRKLIRRIEIKKCYEITCPKCCDPVSEFNKYRIEDIVVSAIYNLDEIWEDDTWRPVISEGIRALKTFVLVDVVFWNSCIDIIERDVLHKWNDWMEKRDDIGAEDPR